MVQLGDGLNVDDNHPLLSEISSLRLAVSRFQDEAHSSSVKLQRQSLESAKASERASHLERENDALRSELAILRANPHPDASPQAHPAVLQVQQLTLSLRRLSDKLSLTEDALLNRTTELTHAMGEATKVKHAAEGAYELAARTRGREEAGKARELELEWKVKAAEEAVKMSDLVVNEYADLVRALNAKTGKGPIAHSRSNSTTSTRDIEEDATSNIGMMTLSESLSQGKFGLQRLLAEFSGETEKLQTELLRLHAEVETAEAKCEAERKVSEQCRVELANALFELQKLRLEDNAAAKMVSRYMKFSQKSTDTLQDAMTALKVRHSATVTTLSAQLYNVSGQLRSSEADAERLRNALDEIGGDILKETYGRRREVALRIRMVNREEKIRESLERWLLRAEETLERDRDGPELHREMVHSAREMLSSIDGPSTSSGSLARLILARSAVEELSKELEVETAKKFHLEGLLAHVNKSSSTFSGQGATGRATNGVANVVEPLVDVSTFQPTPEGEGYKQLSPDPPSIHPDPPPSIEIVLPSPHQDEMEKITLEKSPPSEQSLVLPLASAEFSPPNFDDIQTGTQEVPLSTIPTLVDRSDLNPPGVPENQIPSDEAITDPSRKPYVPEASEHGPIPLVTLEPSSPETQASEVEVLEEPTLPLNSSPKNAPNQKPLFPSPLEQTPAGDQSPNAENPRSPPKENAPLTGDLSSNEPTSSPPTPTTLDIVSPPLLNIPKASPHPLLADLIKVGHRYDDLQRAFRDCHLALETLKANMTSTSPNSTAPHLDKNRVTSPDILRTALERLNDYTEDARVELEIRMADESLMARGFETLLSVPGALSSPSTQPHSPQENIGGFDSAPTQSEVERQIEDFISGADPAVERALGNFTRKLDDIQHDIAALKLAVYDPVLSPTAPSTAPVANGGSWSSWILNTPTSNPVAGARSSPGPAPTFGNVMTTPRLRHSPSLNFQAQPKKGFQGGGTKDAFAGLGLKVPMPSYVHIPETPQRARTVSTMYMLGLGARRPSASGSFASPTQQSKKPPPSLHLEDGIEMADDESESGDDDDADVE